MIIFRNMHKILKIALLLCMFIICTHSFDKPMPVKVELYEGEFFQALLGNPGHNYMLRVDKDSNNTLTLFSLPSSGSKTYSYIEGTNKGGEVLYIGCNCVWVDVVYDPSSYKSDARIPHQGVLGLGPKSQIWRYWHKTTYSSTSMMFGEYDWSVVRTRYHPFEMHFYDNQPTYCVVLDEEYELLYNPDQENTLLPHDLYYAKNALLLDFKEKHLVLELDQHEFSTKLSSGYDKDALRKQHKGNNQIVLGKHSLKGTVTHENYVTKHKIVRPGYSLFSMGNSKPTVDTAICTILLLTIVLWLSLTFSRDKELKKIIQTVISICEIYVLISTVLIMWMQHKGFHCVRYFHFHLCYYDILSEEYIFSPYLLFWSTYSILWLCSLIFAAVYFRTMKCMNARKALTESLLFMTFWISQLDNHGFYEHFVMLLFVCFYAVLRLSSALEAYKNLFIKSKKKKLHACVVVFGVLIWSTYFVFYCGIFPLLRHFWYNFPNEGVSAIYLYTLLVGVPSITLFMNVHIDAVRKVLLMDYGMVQKLKKDKK